MIIIYNLNYHQFYCAKPLPTNQSHMENKQKNACNVFGCNCTTQCVDRNAPKMWCRDDGNNYVFVIGPKVIL